MEKEAVEKKIFQKTDFKFIAAYNVYSKKFNESDEEERQRLNELITRLSEDELSYPSFYEEISKDDSESRRYRFHRSQIESTRKFAYRRAEQKTDRIKRHKR
jgi:hypothetical protein